MKRKGVCVCVCVLGGGGRRGEGEGGGGGGRMEEGEREGGEGGMEESGGRRKEIHHTCVCTSFNFSSTYHPGKYLSISQHDVDQFPTSVRLIEKVAARGEQTTVTLPHDLPDCIKTLVPTASRMGVLHLIRVPPMDDFLCLSQNMSPSFSCKLQPYTGKKFHIPINGVATVFYRFPLL